MDAVLDWDIMLYDGSWSQWGSLTNLSSAVPGTLLALPNDGVYDYTAWATDDLTTDGAGNEAFYLTDYAGNISFGGETVAFDPATHLQQPFFMEAPESPYDPEANTIEIEDYNYWQEGGAAEAGAPSAVSGSAGGC
jgi:hypothetical protein